MSAIKTKANKPDNGSPAAAKRTEIGRVINTEINAEVRKAYLDYAMSVIVMRALPDARDGLKPVHRRILYAMQQIGLTPGGRYTKSAKIVGEVLGKYHPHGDSPVYDALVRMAQKFSMRYPLVDGQGNFGSIDGDPPAAMRYTEARLAKISQELLADLKKDTVEFIENFDRTLKEPTVLPARLPNLLLNGSDGIAVGMATKIPPHNLGEIISALLLMLDQGRLEKQPDHEFSIDKIDPNSNDERQKILAEVYELEKLNLHFETNTGSDDLLKIVKGPDFPTAGFIFDRQAIRDALTTGKGKIPIRGRAEINETKKGRYQIIISELPYQINKANLVAKIANLARDKKINGISDLRDESDREGIRVVVELRRSAIPRAILNKLYKYTELQTSYPVNMVALVDGVPQTLSLRQILLHFLRFRHQVIRRRTIFDLKEAKLRSHILEGLKIALDHLDEVIETIKKSADAETAKTNLMRKFDLTNLQATAILDMQLRRLAALERAKIEQEYQEIAAQIKHFIAILTNPKEMIGILRQELSQLKDTYGDARRTKVVAKKIGEFSDEDLIPNHETIVAITKAGYIKRMTRDTFRTQRRGGKGTAGMTRKEEDEIKNLLFTETHDYLLVFTDRGRVFQLRVWELPEGSRKSKGQAIINLLGISQGEQVKAILSLPKKNQYRYVLMATKNGIIKRTPLPKFKNIRSSGIIALAMNPGDELIEAKLTSGKDQVVIVTKHSKGIRFAETDIPSMGRTARGVKGISLKPGDQAVAANTVPARLPRPKDRRRKIFRDLLLVTENGLGKRTNVYLFPLQKRGGIGVRAANLNDKTGLIADAHIVGEDISQVIITSQQAQVIRLPLKNISRLGRATQGVILMRLNQRKKDRVAAMTILPQAHRELKKNA